METDYKKARLDDILRWVQKNKKGKYTDFLSLGEQKILLKLINLYDDINYRFFGGYSNAERKIAHIYPDFMDKDEVPLDAIRLVGDLSLLSHRDVLGSIVGLGIKREKIGDIIKRQKDCDIIVHKDIAGYILMNLHKIGKERVDTYSINLTDVKEPELKFESINATVASIRLDSVVAAGFMISRNKAITLIKSGMSEVNWEATLDPSFAVKEGDIISLRGYGRIKFETIKGTTKKGRIAIQILRYK
ncbi:RNA-binding protein YlmH, contains S4-like domain [Thermoanaerobacterium sp. RBIITD]|nr:RNA-binding protein YlmH, contains S4-like domain [Thermoanaerobacterium sp. RBIITD]